MDVRRVWGLDLRHTLLRMCSTPVAFLRVSRLYGLTLFGEGGGCGGPCEEALNFD